MRREPTESSSGPYVSCSYTSRHFSVYISNIILCQAARHGSKGRRERQKEGSPGRIDSRDIVPRASRRAREREPRSSIESEVRRSIVEVTSIPGGSKANLFQSVTYTPNIHSNHVLYSRPSLWIGDPGNQESRIRGISTGI